MSTEIAIDEYEYRFGKPAGALLETDSLSGPCYVTTSSQPAGWSSSRRHAAKVPRLGGAVLLDNLYSGSCSADLVCRRLDHWVVRRYSRFSTTAARW